MTHIEVGKDAKITKSMMINALDHAEELKALQKSESYSQETLINVIEEFELSDSTLEAERIAKGHSRNTIALAMDAEIHKRQKLTYLIHPFRKMLPKWMLKEVPMPFMDSDITSLGFLDKLTKKIKKI